VSRVALVVTAAVTAGCAWTSRSPTLEPGMRATVFVRRADLDAGSLELHLARPAVGAAGLPLLLYATGDGGWRSADRGLFRHMASWGYPLAGFSARHYLEHLGFQATSPAHVAADYARLVAFAKSSLGLPPDSPTVLVGFSRGSGLAVVAAAQPELQSLLCGVLAVALTDEEEYVHAYRTRKGRDPRDLGARELATLRPYEQLPRLGRLPLAVIQSTRDAYLPAAKARQLFGPDGELRRLDSIDAGGHTFSGARDALYEQAHAALEWIGSASSSPEMAHHGGAEPNEGHP
jgi:hypothetical protein